MKIEDFAPHRREYAGRRLLETDLDPDPIAQFARWFEEAVAAGIDLPNAMTLATADAHGRPSARMVLLKELDADGFVFFTNTASRKGHDLAANAHGALVFYWAALDRQVRVTGVIDRVADARAEAYFRSRPRESQVAASASAQSRVVASRAELEEQFQALEQRSRAEGIVPLPPDWGGYCLAPAEIEFWQGGEHRLHDRIVFLRENGDWITRRLAP